MLKATALVLFILIGFPISFVEAWVAMNIWQWHVPVLLPEWVTVWTLGWANVAVSLILRNFNYTPKEEVKKFHFLRTYLLWGYASPIVALCIAGLLKFIVG